MRVYIVMLAITLITPAALAGGVTMHWGMDVGALYSDYREYGTDGHRLDREHSLLPGISLYTTGEWQRVFWSWRVSAYEATVDYKGQTQTGKPLSTDSSARFLGMSLNAGYWLDAPRTWGVFGHIAGRQWHRDIHPTGSVQGLSERYRWLETGAGIRHVWSRPDDGTWGQAAALTAFATVAGRVDVNLSAIHGAGLEDVVLHTGDSYGLRLHYTLSTHVGHNMQLRLRPQLAYWRFERSDTVNGTTEPRSETWRFGLMAGVVF